MGIQHEILIGYGNIFDDEDSAIKFLDNQPFVFSEEDRRYITEEGLDNFFSVEHNGIKGGLINHFSESGFWLGNEIDISNIERYNETYRDAVKKWNMVFNIPGGIIKEIIYY